MSWTLEYNGIEQTLEAWGLRGLRRTLASQAADEVTFEAVLDEFDISEKFPYGATITIRRDGAQWFLGRVIGTPRNGSPRSETISYRLAGPWFWLDHLVFQQSWNFSDENGDPQAGRSSHLFLGQTVMGEPMTTGDQITEILEWAIACGAPLKAGTGFPELNVPIREVRELTCGEAIRQMLRWHPDAVTWFDYSTTPPTFHCQARSSLDALSLDVGTKPVSAISINPRYDLQVPAVVLKFEQTNTVDGQNYAAKSEQKYPLTATGEELGALVATIDLQGFNATFAKATIVTAAIDTSSLTWWKSKLPWLNDARLVSAAVADVTRSGSLPRELVSGQIAPWMCYDSEDDTVNAKLTAQWNSATAKPNDANQAASVKIITTDAPLGETVCTSLQSYTSGEDEPTGLAEGLYNALSVLQYEGEITLHEEEGGEVLINAGFTDCNGVGLVLNLTGGLAAWATMRALVQSVTEDVDRGITTLAFGPAGHLGASDLIELLRMTRLRWNYTAPSARVDVRAAARGEIELGRHTPNESASSGAPAYQQFWAAQDTNSIQLDTTETTPKLEIKDGSKTVTMDTSSLPSWATSLQLRKCKICLNNTEMLIVGLLSLAYDSATGKTYNPETGDEVT